MFEVTGRGYEGSGFVGDINVVCRLQIVTVKGANGSMHCSEGRGFLLDEISKKYLNWKIPSPTERK